MQSPPYNTFLINEPKDWKKEYGDGASLEVELNEFLGVEGTLDALQDEVATLIRRSQA